MKTLSKISPKLQLKTKAGKGKEKPKKLVRPLPRTAYQKNAETYKILANPKRLEILNLLREQEMGFDELVTATGVAKANVSQHLALLRHAGLVTVHKIGQNAFYNIVDPRIVEPCRILYQLSIR